MKIQDLVPVKGSKKSIKRVGRGLGSGRGKTSGKGHKGQKARSGGTKGPAFEGGQTVIQRRLPKRGFKNYPFKKQFVILNLKDIARLNLDVVEPGILLKKRIIKNIKNGLKILGVGELIKPITIKAHAFSSSAISKIDAIGGKYETI